MSSHGLRLFLPVAITTWLLLMVVVVQASTPSKTYHHYHRQATSTTTTMSSPVTTVVPSLGPTAMSDEDDLSSSSGSDDSDEEEPDLTTSTSSTKGFPSRRRRRSRRRRSNHSKNFFPEFGTSTSSLQLWKQKRQDFLDRIALVSASLLKREEPHLDLQQQAEQPAFRHDDHDMTPQTDLTLPGRQFHIVTTAALPWMTGTAVNPLLRAAYLHRRTQEINTRKHNNTTNNPQPATLEMTKDTLHVQVDLPMDIEHKSEPDDNTTASSDDTPFTTTTTDHSNTTTQQSKAHNHSDNHHHQQQQHQQQWVTLVIPWLELEEDQQELYGQVFASPADQESYIRDWLAHHAGMPDVADPESGLRLLFYPARYHAGLRSIFAMGDMIDLIVADRQETDVCILEEPEHCNWFRAPGQGWTQAFSYVIGIVHTNYKEYASAQYHGLWTAPAISMISSAMVRAYVHQVIKLSDVLQTFAPEKEASSNVHGVREDFLQAGLRRAECHGQNTSTRDSVVEVSSAVTTEADPVTHAASTSSSSHANQTQVYFIGKLLWAKGLDLMLEMQDYYKQCTGQYFAIDIYGSGPEQKAIQRAFWGRRHHHHSRRPAHSHGANATTASTASPSFSALNASSTTVVQNHSSPQKQTRRRRLSFPRPRRAMRQRLDRWRTRVREAKAKKTLLQQQSKQQFQKIKETIQSTELPATVHEFRRSPIPATFPGRVDHAKVGDQYKIFVNPSISEVLCTTTAEALAMGKFVIIPVHPSNTFFLKFPNCLAYRNKFEFAANLEWALTHEPEPLTPELAHEFTWEAATDRFIRASAVTWKQARERERLGLSKRDERIAWFHNELGKGPKGDLLRKVLGGGPASAQVKYVMEQTNNNKTAEEEEDDEKEEVEEGESDSDDEGLTSKLRRSSFAEALRATMANGLPTIL